MSIERMADRTLPLAERVQAALLCWDMDDAHEAARADLIADVAAADRLARAADGWSEDDSGHEELVEYNRTLDAYRARMAQGVGRGE